MAIKKVKLPNNSVVDINDARIPGVDPTPTSGSTNVVTSGGVYSNAVTAVGTSGNNLTVTKAGSTSSLTVPFATKAAQDGDGNVITTTYYPKTIYEWNKALSCGSNGKICIGKFQMYDSNVTIHLSITTNITYNANIVIQSQNLNRTTSTGTIRCDVYGDIKNTITPLLSVFRPNPNTQNGAVEVYANLPGWSKNILHIQALGLEADATDVVTSISEIPTSITGKTALVIDTQSDNGKICNLFTNSLPPTVTESTVSGWGFTKNHGTVTGVSIGNETFNPSNGMVVLPELVRSDSLIAITNAEIDTLMSY